MSLTASTWVDALAPDTRAATDIVAPWRAIEDGRLVPAGATAWSGA